MYIYSKSFFKLALLLHFLNSTCSLVLTSKFRTGLNSGLKLVNENLKVSDFTESSNTKEVSVGLQKAESLAILSGTTFF